MSYCCMFASSDDTGTSGLIDDWEAELHRPTKHECRNADSRERQHIVYVDAAGYPTSNCSFNSHKCLDVVSHRQSEKCHARAEHAVTDAVIWFAEFSSGDKYPVLSANDAWLHAHGLTRDEITGANVIDLLGSSPSEKQCIIDLLLALASQTETENCIYETTITSISKTGQKLVHQMILSQNNTGFEAVSKIDFAVPRFSLGAALQKREDVCKQSSSGQQHETVCEDNKLCPASTSHVLAKLRQSTDGEHTRIVFGGGVADYYLD
eukprot:SAG31_NODE_734_length_12489_cov_6.922034_8_plen_265_part_00